MIKAFVIFGLLVTSNLIIMAQSYTELENTGLAQVQFSCCALGDVNADGLPDIALSGNGLETTVIYTNKGNGLFEKSTTNTGLPAFEFGKIDFLDFDNDGDLDLVMDGRTNSIVFPIPNFYKNDGTGQFTTLNYMSFSYTEFTSFAFGDFDNDGDIDLFSATAGLFENNGGNNFEKVETPIPSLANGSADWGDFDKDGDLDLLVTGDNGWPDYSFSKIYINQGSNVFMADTTSSLEKIRYGMAKWGDYDSDGYMDIFLCGSAQNIVKIYRNNNLKFEEQSIVSGYSLVCSSIDLGDFNNDGWLDFIVTGMGINDVETKLFKNNGGVDFKEVEGENIQGVENGVIKFGDVDNDSDLDIIVTGNGNRLSSGYREGVTKIYLNNEKKANHRPDAPKELTASIYTTSALLHWSLGSDPETPSKGLGYVIELKRGHDDLIVSPASYQLGRNVKDSTLLIKGLEFGYYYWRVKTVDNGFLSSAYSEEHSFYIGDSVPVISYYPKTTKIPEESESFIYTVKNIGKGILNLNEIKALDDWFTLTEEPRGDSTNIIIHFSKNQAVVRNGRIRLTSDNADNSPFIIEFTQSGDSIFKHDVNFNLAGLKYCAIGAADYDNDNDLDLLLSGEDQNSFTQLYQNSSSGYSKVNSSAFPQVSGGDVKWADYDNDGDMDLLITGSKTPYESEKQSKLFKNLSNGSFVEDRVSKITAMFANTADFGDCNNDGFMDLIISGGSDQGVRTTLFINDKGKYLNEISSFSLPGEYYANVFFVDFDNDLDMDILLEGKLYENLGNNNFSIYKNGDFIKGRICSWGDFDNDGDVDIFIGGLILLNDGNGNFKKSKTASLPQNIMYHDWGDYDNDGDLDLIFKINYETYLFNNNGHAEFTQQEGVPYADIQGSVAFIDCNNDSNLDVVSTGFNRSGIAKTEVYTNKYFKSNTVPNPPTTSKDSMYADTAYLFWNKGSDEESSSNGLYYNCYLYRVGGDTILNSMSDHHSGKLRLPFLGNVQKNLGWKIHLDSAGVYRWAVQTIDQAYAGSLFSNEKEFEAAPFLSFNSTMENQKWQADKNYSLIWDEAFVDYAKLEYQINGEENWTTILDSITASEKYFVWRSPNIQPDELLIRISNPRYDLSDTISVSLIPSITITAPLSGSKIMPGDSLIIKWEKLYSDTLTISYRPQNEYSWSMVANSLVNESNTYKWIVPVVKPGVYWIKVCDNKTDESVDTVLINILPYLEIVSPESKQQVSFKGSTEIKWVSSYADKISISYKASKNYYWRTLSYGTPAAQESLIWDVSQYFFQEDSCQILIRDINSNAADTSGYFYLVDKITTGIVADIHPNIDIRFYPNPVKNILHIELPKNVDMDYGLCIFNANGEIVYENKISTITSEFDLGQLSAGFYFVNLFDGKRTFNGKIVVQ